MSKYNEKEIKEAFLEDKGNVLRSLYKNTYPLVLRLVVGNKGSESDAKDILQEAFLIILTKIREDKFTLSCEFNTYIYAICKNLWLKSLRNTKYQDHKIVDLSNIEDVDYFVNFEKEYKLNSQYFIFRTHFHSLSQLCKDILIMFFDKRTFIEIAEVLELANYEYARKKKYKCKKTLIERIKKDPNYKNLEQ
jgi:RNA polymerase sigma factor (sigma-70 family)